MANTPQRRQRARQPDTAAQTPDNTGHRMRLEYRDITDIRPYEFNPRDNAAAIESVKNSIKTFGFIIPVVVDSNNVLVAGHTRVEAAKLLGMSEVPSIQVDYLTEKEIQAFRVIDNKVAELAKWDFDLLSQELSSLQGSGLNLTDFGYTREELDCLTDVVADDCLNAAGIMDVAAREAARRRDRRAPAQARFVLGEFTFFVPASEATAWMSGLRSAFDFNEAEIAAEIKRRLGILTRD